jgi:MFS family permease
MSTNEELKKQEKNVLERILDQKATILIVLGFSARVLMLIIYYILDTICPSFHWGDLGFNYKHSLYYPPLTYYFLAVFRFLSFGSIRIFAFWAFSWEIILSVIFYFVLKSFNIKRLNYAYGLYLLNPFFFVTMIFGLGKCGYQMTDYFFFFFLFLAFYFCPKEEVKDRYLFYIFLGLSICVKYFTLPVLGFFLLKFLIEKDWEELKYCFISIIPLLLTLLIIPFFTLEWFRSQLTGWYHTGPEVHFLIRIIPSLIIAAVFIVFRLKKATYLEMIIVSIMGTAAFMFFSFPFVEWFVSIIFYGMLTQKDFFSFEVDFGFIKRKVDVNNSVATFYLSFIGVLLTVIVIITLQH